MLKFGFDDKMEFEEEGIKIRKIRSKNKNEEN